MSASVSQLAALDPITYAQMVKSRLRQDDLWLELLDPRLVERTRASLTRIIESLDRQSARIGDTDPEWTRRARVLRKFAVERLKAMAPAELTESNTKEAKAWRAFSARLAKELAKTDPSALERLKTPYGGLTAAEWLETREGTK